MAEYRVIDADGHFDEPSEIWPQYLEKKFHPMAPRHVRDSQGRPRIFVGGEMKEYIPMPPGHTPGDTMAGGRDPHALQHRHRLAARRLGRQPTVQHQ